MSVGHCESTKIGVLKMNLSQIFICSGFVIFMIT